MHYCDFDERMYATIPLLILILLLAFYALGSTADAYLTPALEKVSTTLKMSESLAGVTLLALGNGAPDVIASISAADGAEGGMFFSVGALTGSGIFVTGVVSAVVILSSKKEIKVLGIHMFRDIGFYVLGLVVLVIAAIVGELNIFFAAAFILIYVAYVVTVVIMDTLEKRARKAGASKGMRATFVEENEEDEEEAYFYQDTNDRIVEIERIEQRKTVQDGDPQRFRISLNNQDKESFRSDFKTVPHLSFWILQGIAFTLSVLICFLTPKNHGPRRTMVIFSVFAFIMSIVWIYFLAGILVDTIALLGVILRFPPTFLAITMLAWGNAIGDVMANSAFAKKGLAKMALTA